MRLRDLAGLIVIDFIDMDERKNNAAVEKMMKDKLKSDRARIQVGRISGFGLMEMSRQRLRPGMIEATTAPCPSCHGTGLIRSDDNMALSILRQIEEEGVRRRSREVLVRAPVPIANYLMNQKREHIAQIELRYGLSVRIEADVHLVSPDFALEKFKTATRVVPEPSAHVVSVDTSIMDQIDEDEAIVEEDEAPVSESTAPSAAEGEGEDKPKKRRRRRRRGGKKNNNGGADAQQDEEGAASDEAGEVPAEVTADAAPAETDAPDADVEASEKPKRVRRSRSRAKPKTDEIADADAPAEVSETQAVAETPAADVEAEAVPEKPKRKPRARKPKAVAVEEAPVEAVAQEAPAVVETVAEPAPVVDATPEPQVEVQPEPTPEPQPKPTPEPKSEPEVLASVEPSKPKRRGWWSLGK